MPLPLTDKPFLNRFGYRKTLMFNTFLIGTLICLMAIPGINTSIYWFIPLILVLGFTTPVTKTSSRAFVLVESTTTLAFCENIELANIIADNNPNLFSRVILFIV